MTVKNSEELERSWVKLEASIDWLLLYIDEHPADWREHFGVKLTPDIRWLLGFIDKNPRDWDEKLHNFIDKNPTDWEEKLHKIIHKRWKNENNKGRTQVIQRTTPIQRTTLPEPKPICLADGKEVIVSDTSKTDAPSRLGGLKRKKIKAKSPAELDHRYIQEITDLLETFLASSTQSARFKVLREYAETILHYTLEWLCRRNNQIPKDNNLFNCNLSQLLVALLPYERQLMRTWYSKLDYWCEKFSTSGRYRKPLTQEDLPRYKAFIQSFLHDVKVRSKELTEFMEKRYPIQAIPQNDTCIPIQIEKQNQQVSKLSQKPREKRTWTRQHCPICNSPYQKTRKGIFWCPACRYYPDHIVIGRRLDSYQYEDVLIAIDDLPKHGHLLGGTGDGKTNTAKQIVHQLREHGYPCWIFECDKEHFRQLKNMRLRNPNASKEFWHFTPKYKKVNPFTINPLIPPLGYSLEDHLEHFGANFEFGYELPLWAGTQFKQALIKVYKDAGWDIENSCPKISAKEGDDLYPLPLELNEAIDAILENQYSEESRQDAVGVLRNRVRDFNRLSLGKMFNCRRSIPWSELVTKNIVFELQYMDDRTKRFFICLILTMLYEYFKVRGNQDGLKLFVIIEEASTVLTRELGGGEVKSESGITAEIIETLVSKSRAYGLGLLIMDQTPEKLPFRVRAVPQTTIVHNLENEDSIEMVYKMTRGIHFLPKQVVGEARVVSPSIHGSQSVKVEKFPDYRDPTDQEMKEWMAPFYEAHPWMQNPDPDIRERIDALTVFSRKDVPVIKEEYEEEYEDLLMGFTEADIDEALDGQPWEIDLLCAECEKNTLFADPKLKAQFQKGYKSIDERYKGMIRARCEHPNLKNEIRKLQNQLMQLDPHDVQLKKKLQFYFPYLKQWAKIDSSSSIALSVFIYFLRLLVYKYLKFAIERRVDIYNTLLEILVENINQTGNNEVK